MLQSMTGFGKVSSHILGKTIRVEIKALNSKSLDLYVKLPQIYREVELDLRRLVGNKLHRGKLDLTVVLENAGSEVTAELNLDLAKRYLEDLQKLHVLTGEDHPDYLAQIVRMPDVYTSKQEELKQEERKALLQLVSDACDQLISFRRQEGQALEQDFSQQLSEIEGLLAEVDTYEQQRVDVIRERMKKGLSELQGVEYDQGRLEQEMIYYIEKLDVSEEKMRLANHLKYFAETMKQENPGKKLGFITQEIGREINTLGSKSYQVDLQKLVVEMKDRLEKMKEQVLNTL
ncbi:MAG: YicC family protein [Bacteroidetes bacterium]|nr:MAG: YicC family protein [Bacteroidota bacterium]